MAKPVHSATPVHVPAKGGRAHVSAPDAQIGGSNRERGAHHRDAPSSLGLRSGQGNRDRVGCSSCVSGHYGARRGGVKPINRRVLRTGPPSAHALLAVAFGDQPLTVASTSSP